MRTQLRIGFLTATLCGIASHAAFAQAAIQRVAYQGQTVSYNSNSILLGALNSPYTNGLGQVGFTGAATPGGNFVWFDNGITWLNTDDTSATVSGAETTCGISNTGGFIYSPSYNGGDAVYTDNGNLLSEGQPHPAVPGQFSTFNSRPVMMPDGTAYWIGGYTATTGGTTAGRVFLKCTDTTNPGTITKILQTGDIVDGLAVSSTGLGFAFDVSDNNAHTMITALVGAVTASDGRMLVDGASVATEGQPTPAGGENWSSTFVTNPSINNSGNYIYTGDTTGATTSDQVMVYNGSIVLREGMTVDGITLGSATNAASINNLGKVAFIWTAAAPTTKVLFFGDASNPSAASRILAVGDQVDYTGDNVADATVTDFKASTAVSLGLSLSDHNYVYAEVGLTDLAGGPEYEAIVKVPGPTPDCPADITGDNTVGVADLLAVIGAWGPCPVPPAACPADINHDNTVGVADLLTVIAAWGACP